MLYRMHEVDFHHIDSRGELVQLVHGGYSQFNILKSKQGVLRGGHYHKLSTEMFYVVTGSVNVYLMSQEMVRDSCHFHEGDFFEIPPGIVHGMSFPEDCILAAMYDINVEQSDGTKDIYPAEIN